MNSIAVCIISHNTRELLRRCLKSVKDQAPQEMIVVDNASSDDSAEMVRGDFSSVKVFQNPVNRGYAAASNQAIAETTSPYLLLLNADTVLGPGALEALARYLDASPRVAVVGPRLINPDGTVQTSCFHFPTLPNLFMYLSNAYRLIRYAPVLNRYSLRAWDHSQPRLIPWVLGAALAIRRDAFEAVGGFDESFYMYFEEVDLCYRLSRAGWQVHFAPVTEVLHVGGASADQQRAEMTVRYFKSLAHFYRQHYSRLRLIGLFILVEAFAMLRWTLESVSSFLSYDATKRATATRNKNAWRRVLAEPWQGQAAQS